MTTTSTTAPADYTTDGTYLALLAGVLAEPADDNARLVLAGWLEENGQEERGQFIQSQISLAALGESPDDTQCLLSQSPRHWCSACAWREKAFPLERQAYWLLKARGHDWLTGIGLKTTQHDGGVSEGVSYEIVTTAEIGSGIACDFTRGFVSHVTLSPADWFTHHAALYWQPGDTVECERCQLLKIPGYCPRCEGKGRVTRPVPATAQPLEVVRLTAAPLLLMQGAGEDSQGLAVPNACRLGPRAGATYHPYSETGGETATHLERVRALLAKEWPRIRFRLPGDAE